MRNASIETTENQPIIPSKKLTRKRKENQINEINIIDQEAENNMFDQKPILNDFEFGSNQLISKKDRKNNKPKNTIDVLHHKLNDQFTETKSQMEADQQQKSLNHVMEEMAMLRETNRINEMMKEKIKYNNPNNFNEEMMRKVQSV